jgi:photosystem II stability/assembly factor-like uncharacterized protein
MKYITFPFLLITLLITNSYSNWYFQTSGTTVTLNCVYFASADIGFIAGNSGVILKTTNKGANWQSLNSGTTGNLYSVRFINTSTGFAAGDNLILKTTNGGASWQVNHNISGISLRTIFFLNASTGYAAGSGGVVLKTTNTGGSWNMQVIYSPDVYTSIFFSNPNTGYLVGLDSRYYKSTNSGVNWSAKVTFVSKHYFSVQFLNDSTGFIVGGWVNSTIIRSDDGGENWINLLGNAFGVRLYSGSFLDVDQGLVVGRYGTIMRTKNGGYNWLTETSGTNVYLYGVQYLDTSTAYAVGDTGVILSTLNLIGIKPINSEVPNQFSLSQNYPNPFNPSTKIRFDIPPSKGARGMMVRLTIYDALGRDISTLVNEGLKPGIYEVSWDGSNYPSGVYFYKLSAGDYIETKKMILLK